MESVQQFIIEGPWEITVPHLSTPSHRSNQSATVVIRNADDVKLGDGEMEIYFQGSGSVHAGDYGYSAVRVSPEMQKKNVVGESSAVTINASHFVEVIPDDDVTAPAEAAAYEL
jgi:hypothetical protein